MLSSSFRGKPAIGSGKSLASAAAGPTDPYWANVVSLLHMDGADSGTTFTDQKSKVWTPSGSVQTKTAAPKFGTANGQVLTASSGLTSPHSADFEFGSGNFTYEVWYKLPGSPITCSLFDKWDGGAAERALFIGFVGNLPGVNINGGTLLCNAGSRGADGSWHFFSLTRNGSSWWLHIDGVRQATSTNASAIATSPGTPVSCMGGPASWYLPSNSQCDEQRITKGVARYTSANYTPPTAAFPNS